VVRFGKVGAMSRSESILTAFLGVLVLAVVVAFFYFWSGRHEDGTVSRVATQPASDVLPSTAQSAYGEAVPVARAWASDAVLLHARGNWPVGTTFLPDRGSWNFLFFSPSRQMVALVVAGGSEAKIVSQNETREHYQPAAIDNWQVDSPDIVEQLLANGGEAFLEEHGEVSLALSLNATDHLLWMATLNATNDNKLFRLRIDPANGRIIE
jgi:hypothetical protein